MATRSTICVKVPQSRMGKSYQYTGQPDSKFPTPAVVCEKEYIEIYRHWDGYPEGAGKDLLEIISADLTPEENFDKMMSEVISGGNQSSMHNAYHAWRGEEWEDVKPSQYDELPNVSEEYQYLLDTDGNLYFRDDYSHEEMTLLSAYLENPEEEN